VRASILETPLGLLRIASDEDEALVRISFDEALGECSGPVSPDLIEAFRAYFAGDQQALGSLRLAAEGTPFQHKVWGAVAEIPCGAVESYGELAKRVGGASLSRAVGAANGANPLLLAVPCHRVVGADGDLRGYAAGIERKRWLLQHEGARWGQQSLFATLESS
jgi:methylated-DNA-[protein]-cysteine S-methyltransferase